MKKSKFFPSLCLITETDLVIEMCTSNINLIMSNAQYNILVMNWSLLQTFRQSKDLNLNRWDLWDYWATRLDQMPNEAIKEELGITHEAG
jgi:hypothetical protein